VEGSIDAVRSSVDSMRSELSRLTQALERGFVRGPDGHAGILGPYVPVGEHQPASTNNTDRPNGHRDAHDPREYGFGNSQLSNHLPNNGTHPPYIPQAPAMSAAHEIFDSHIRSSDGGGGVLEPYSARNLGGLPKLQFPSFDGENPKLWQSRCEDYFHMYSVDPRMWIKIASMQFVGPAANWWQSVEYRVATMSWGEFGYMIQQRFGRDQYQMLLRQLFRIRQTGSVAAYVEDFLQLIDKLNAYQQMSDPLYYTLKFVDGLRDDIKAVIMLQRPQDLDTATVLAQLQEEAGAMLRKKDYRWSEVSSSAKTSARQLAVQQMSTKDVTQPVPGKSDERTYGHKFSPSSTDDRITSLYAYWKAKGLCYKCGLQYSRDHKCSETVQLHLVEELWQMAQVPETEIGYASPMEEDEHELNVLMLSQAAVEGSDTPRTMKFVGHIAGMDILALLDSGSSHSFISSVVADNMTGVTSVLQPLRVQVANGSQLSCNHQIVNASWSISGVSFSSTLKVLPLSTYDLIVGMDWLEKHSPMLIHWSQKWLSIPLRESTVTLYGVKSSVMQTAVIQVCSIQELSDKEQAILSDLPADIQVVLFQYPSVFEIPRGMPPTRECDHQIPLVTGARPVQMRPYRYAPALKNEIENQVSEMLQSSIIQHSHSEFASSVILVKKKDQTYRFCVDYGHLNALTVKTKYPVPIIDEFLDELHGAVWFSTLDLRAGFHQIRMNPTDQHKTAFQTHHGHYEFRVMPFGLSGAPATFQSAMNSTLAPLLRKSVLVFFDNILVYNSTWDEHLHHLTQVLQILHREQWYIKLSKCAFAKQQIAYLGHVISPNGVATDPAKVEAVSSWPTPANCKELRGFLGLAGYYRKFVKNFGVIARPLTDLLKKGVVFLWTQVHDTAFQALKQSLVSAPVLALPNFTRPFAIETDASSKGIGAVLLQDHHPLAYVSKALGVKNQGLSTYEKEYLAILMAVDKWRQYLQHAEFLIYSDHRSLSHLTEQRLSTPWQQRVFSKLIGLQYKVVYKKGVDNGAADALSRRPYSELFSLSSATPQWMLQVMEGYKEDDQAQGLLVAMLISPHTSGQYTLNSGIIRYKGRVWVRNNTLLQQQIMEALHDSPVGGHSGFPVTYRWIKQLFSWPSMKALIKQYVTSCTVCQQAKPDRSRYPGLLQPLPVPTQAWEVISMDFVEGLPRSNNANTILVVVDTFSKYSHFLPLLHPFSALKVAQLFMDFVYKLHGLPLSIVSDRDRIFTSRLWQELFRLSGTTLKMSTSYHPQTDGQTEHVNQCLETYLRSFVHACPSKWSAWLSVAEYWYNTTFHSSLGRSPFEVLYGREPRNLGLNISDASTQLDLQTWLQQRELMVKLIRQHLLRAQQRMKFQADKGRTEREFAIGDMVYLKLQPYVQSSVAPRAAHKLSFKFFGPYMVLQRVGKVAYKLQLPASASIHPVVHVSQLKRAVGNRPVNAVLPDSLSHLQVPLQALDRRVVVRGNKQVQPVLIKWSHGDDALATWENEEALHAQFPTAAAWGQAAFQGEDNVRRLEQPQQMEDARTELEHVQIMGRRKRRPSSRVSGAEWVQ
jgi:hypothetical protein